MYGYEEFSVLVYAAAFKHVLPILNFREIVRAIDPLSPFVSSMLQTACSLTVLVALKLTTDGESHVESQM